MPEIAIQTAGGTRERYPLAKPRVTIGRSRESDIFLPDQWLSRHHAAIEQRDEAFWVNDLRSKNGTLLNGEPVADWRRLRPGDVITLGEHTLTFCAETEQEEEDEREPEGTRVFSVKELSAINTHPAIDLTELQRQNRVPLRLNRDAATPRQTCGPSPEPPSASFDTAVQRYEEAIPRGEIVRCSGP